MKAKPQGRCKMASAFRRYEGAESGKAASATSEWRPDGDQPAAPAASPPFPSLTPHRGASQRLKGGRSWPAPRIVPVLAMGPPTPASLEGAGEAAEVTRRAQHLPARERGRGPQGRARGDRYRELLRACRPPAPHLRRLTVTALYTTEAVVGGSTRSV